MKVGDYVRTTKGNSCNEVTIRKLTYIDEDYNMYILDTFVDYGYGDSTNYISKYDIINSSPDIIDLIEVGDIVNYEQLNGGVVLNKKEKEISTWSILPNTLKNEDIKSVITREQLKDLEYKVEEDEK